MTTLALRDYQLVARDFLRSRGRAGLFLDLGLGKTASSLSALEPRHLPALVIAPKRVAEEVWSEEVRKWRPDLTISVAEGSPSARAEALTRPTTDIVALSRNNVKDLLTGSGLARALPYRTIIIDELSSFKNYSGVWFKTMRKACNRAGVEYVWGLTGSPTPNGLMDLWSQVALLDNGARLGRNITTFRERFFYAAHRLPNGVVTDWQPRPGAKEHIYRLIEDLCLSMESAGRVSIPEVVFNPVQMTLPPRIRQAYNELSKKLVTDLRDLVGGEVHTVKNAATLSGKLSQINAGFMYPDPDEFGLVGPPKHLHSQRIDALKEIVEAASGPVLVFYRFTPEKEAVLAAFPEASTTDRPNLQRDWNDGQIPLLVAHPISLGHGMNLQYGGHTIVWMSIPWSLEEWDQANKRLARPGQTHPVTINMLVTRDTVDKVIWKRLADRRFDQKELLDHLESPI